MKIWTWQAIQTDLKNTTTHKQTWRIAAPMILSNMTIPLVGLVDSAMMGHLAEDYYLAAVGLASALFTFIIWAMSFLRMITTGLVAQAFGAQNYNAIRQWLYLPMLLAVIISATILLLNPWLIELIIWWVDGSQQVEAKVLEYWNIRIYGLPISLLNAVLIGWYLGMHNARIPFIMLMLTNISNAVLDWWLVSIGMDVDGVALASVIAESLGLMVALIALPSVLKRFPLKEKLRLAWHKLGYLLNLNKDLLIRTLALETVLFTIHARGSELGDQVMAINAILLNFLLVVSNGLDGIANAVEALVGKAMGRKNWQEFRSAVIVGGFWSLITSLLFSVIFLFFGYEFIQWITDIGVLKEAIKPFLIYSILVPIVCVASFWLDGIFIGASAIRTMRNSMLVALAIGFIPAYYLLKPFAAHGIWLAFFSFMIMRALSSWYFFNRGLKQGRYIETQIIYNEVIYK
ncbi:MAG: MATE family efflux transporter [Gammaproteobacteria bacterium]|nr:MATE family efflux transporter [Gammaproteobacteria bacterium]